MLLHRVKERAAPRRACPETLLFLCCRFVGAHLERVPSYLNLGLGMGLQIQPPTRVLCCSGRSTNDNQSLPIGEIRGWWRSQLASSAPGRCEEEDPVPKEAAAQEFSWP